MVVNSSLVGIPLTGKVLLSGEKTQWYNNKGISVNCPINMDNLIDSLAIDNVFCLENSFYGKGESHQLTTITNFYEFLEPHHNFLQYIDFENQNKVLEEH